MDIFYDVLYGNFILFAFCAICLANLFNPFIDIWLGSEYLFPSEIVICIVMQFFIDGMRQTVLTFKDAMGIFKQDQFKPICEAIINLGMSILLTYKFGTIGIVLGTIISMLFSFFVEAIILFKYGFKQNVKEYLLKTMKHCLIFVFSFLVTIFITRFLNINNNILNFSLKCICTVFIAIITLLLATFKSNEFKYFKSKIIKNRM